MGNCKTKQGTSLHYKYKQQDLTQGNELYNGFVFLSTFFLLPMINS